MTSALSIFLTFLRLGVTSFGGPVAHLAYFREAFVVRRKWLDEAAYADLVALCQFLPGPASSQVGLAIGLRQGGLAGGVAAWTAFTLPSAILMIALALGADSVAQVAEGGLLAGLKLAAVAVVAHAVLSMARKLCPSRLTQLFALGGATLALLSGHAWGQLMAIALGAYAGWRFLDSEAPATTVSPVSRNTGEKARRRSPYFLGSFLGLLILLPLLASLFPQSFIALAEPFYRAGALVFGGGHVVLPLLEGAFVQPDRLTQETFLAGYGAAQAVPGPLFTFGAYLGTALNEGSAMTRVLAGMGGLLMLYLPSFLLLPAVLPHWENLRRHKAARAALAGTNATVVGLLLAAFYDPVFLAGVPNAASFLLALVAFHLLAAWKTPSWAVVLICGAVGLTGLLNP